MAKREAPKPSAVKCPALTLCLRCGGDGFEPNSKRVFDCVQCHGAGYIVESSPKCKTQP